MAASLHEILSRVPLWIGKRILEVEPLTGGITNQNFRILVDSDAFVLRISGQHSDLLGIDREDEFAAHRAAADLSIAPKIVHFIRPEGYLVTQFVEGRPIPVEKMRLPHTLRRVTATLRRVHSMEPIPGTFSPFNVVNEYAQTCQRFGVLLPDELNWLEERMENVRSAVARVDAASHPCHNDLLNENFLDDGEIRILDWEYAGMGDPFFDLANFSANHGFDEASDHALLELYFGEVTPSCIARLNLMKPVSDLREAMWGKVQLGISTLEFDFDGYAQRHFDRARAGFSDPRFEEWQKDLARDD